MPSKECYTQKTTADSSSCVKQCVVAACYSVLMQRVVACCSVLQCVAVPAVHIVHRRLKLLQGVAAWCCSMLH